MSLPRDIVGLSLVCEFDISWSYSLAFWLAFKTSMYIVLSLGFFVAVLLLFVVW